MGNTLDDAAAMILVFDFGTSYFKTGLIDQQGRVVALHRAPTPSVSPAPGRLEILPHVFQQTVRQACAAVAAKCDGGLARVAAVTFATQANTFTLLDAHDAPLLPLIVWSDSRASSLDPMLKEIAQDPAFHSATGLPTLNHQFTLGKLRWLAEHEPAILRAARRVCWLPDLLTHWLTGVHATEASIAALSGLFDVAAWRWSDERCRHARIDTNLLSPIMRAGTGLGNALPGVAAELGLPATCRVIAGCLDHYAAAIGVGNDRAGRVSETTGTVLATLAVVNAWETGSDERIFRGPGPSEGAFFRMTFGEVSANLLDHYRGCLPDLPSFESLSTLCGSADRLWLDDEAPVDSIKTTIRAWAPTEPRPDVVRAIFQAVARALVRQVQQVATQPVDAVRSSGGGARSRAWLQLKADALKKLVIAPATEEPALVGAATLAVRALGWPPFAETDAAAAEQRVFTP